MAGPIKRAYEQREVESQRKHGASHAKSRSAEPLNRAYEQRELTSQQRKDLSNAKSRDAQLERKYERPELTAQQSKDISNARSRAVRQAWAKEKEFVQQGNGTRDWTPEQQRDIISKGRVGGFEGHHMRSVSCGETYESRLKIAGDKNNIQFLERTKANNEHIRAHGGNTHNRTNGYYDVKLGKMRDFGNGEPHAPQAKKLSCPAYKFDQKKAQVQTHNQERAQTHKQESKQAQYDKYGVKISDEKKQTTESRTQQQTYNRRN